MKKTESQLMAECLKVLRQRRRAVVLKHADRFTSGIPDVSVTDNGTTWLEFKTNTRVIWEHELQRITCIRLEIAGRCLIVLYDQAGGQTHIILPRQVKKNGTFVPMLSAPGIDHEFVARVVRAG